LSEAEQLCSQIEQKDKELMEDILSKKDSAKTQWLKNWVNIEVFDLERKDRDEVRNQIDMYSEDLQKLNKIISKLEE